MARKKKGLPFVVQPRLQPIIELIGTPESGQIEIARKGYLTVAEKTIVQTAMKDGNGLTKSYMIARDIASAEGLKVDQIFADLAADVQPAYMNKYGSELAEILALTMDHEEKMKLIVSTALLICRVDPEWTATDSVELHPDLQTALFELYKDEERKSTEALEAAAEEADKSQEGAEGKD